MLIYLIPLKPQKQKILCTITTTTTTTTTTKLFTTTTKNYLQEHRSRDHLWSMHEDARTHTHTHTLSLTRLLRRRIPGRRRFTVGGGLGGFAVDAAARVEASCRSEASLARRRPDQPPHLLELGDDERPDFDVADRPSRWRAERPSG